MIKGILSCDNIMKKKIMINLHKKYDVEHFLSKVPRKSLIKELVKRNDIWVYDFSSDIEYQIRIGDLLDTPDKGATKILVIRK
jgi:hypothetical protein